MFEAIITRVRRDKDKNGSITAAVTAAAQANSEDSRIFQQRISNKKLNKLMVPFSRGAAQMEE
ncbi:hypothetical protein ACLOJK_030536 [Asimina triloba]